MAMEESSISCSDISETDSENEVKKRYKLSMCTVSLKHCRKRKFAALVKTRASEEIIALAKRLACIVLVIALAEQDNVHARTRLAVQVCVMAN